MIIYPIFIYCFVLPFILTYKQFGYLHNKAQSDFYGSIPKSRSGIFTAKFSAVLTVQLLSAAVVYFTCFGNTTLFFSAQDCAYRLCFCWCLPACVPLLSLQFLSAAECRHPPSCISCLHSQCLCCTQSSEVCTQAIITYRQPFFRQNSPRRFSIK